MRKKTTLSISLLVSVLLLASCSSKTADETTKVQKIEKSSETCAKEYFNNSVSNTLSSCISCHSSGGQAESTRLIFDAPLQENKDTNFETLKNFLDLTDTLIIEKGTNRTPHTGGVAMNSASEEIMNTFMLYLSGEKQCFKEVAIDTIKNDAYTLSSPSATLRSAAFKLTGSAPSDNALATTTSESTLDTKLDEYMKSDYFYDWLALKFNDFLLTDFYKPYRNAENLLNSDDFPHKQWYEEYATGTKEDKPNMFNNSERQRIYSNVNAAIAREPINLMLHVIKNNRPFSEILTADYLLVNPYSARTYGINIDGFTFDNADLNLTIDEIEAKYPVDALKEAKIDGIPHAGVLTTITYLNRFPSTNTNLDRHRSAKTQLFFLDTDILALANRPIDAVDVIGNSATWTNPNCTVCHNVMEPIAGAFSNWDNRGRYRPGWRVDLAPFSQEPGISIEKKVPTAEANSMLQWLAKEITQDDRFSMASVKMFYKALLGRDALKKPQKDDANYKEALEAYTFENDILEEIKKKFQSSNMNAKVIIKEIIKSPLYRANSLNINNEILAKNFGQANLITPEELNKKIYDTMGYYWSRYMKPYSQKDNNNSSNHRLLRDDNYKTLYGGINSGSITKRVDELNGVMANIQLRMAIQMSCFPTTRDFYFPMKERKLFPYVTQTQEPITEGSIADIKKNIQYLHKHILGEDLALDDAEIEATYKLFYDTYIEGKERVYNGDEERTLLYECRMYYNPLTYKRLSDEGHVQDEIVYDDNYVIRAWSAVITYLLSDFKFLYETSGK